jgi:hypothetical protein
MGVNMLAGLDVAGSKSDNLTVFSDASSVSDAAGGDFVTKRDTLCTSDFFLPNLGSSRKVNPGDNDVVQMIQANGKRP